MEEVRRRPHPVPLFSTRGGMEIAVSLENVYWKKKAIKSTGDECPVRFSPDFHQGGTLVERPDGLQKFNKRN